MKYINYVVKKGDTLWSIWKKSNPEISWDAWKGLVITINGIDNPDKILAGQTIKIPAPLKIPTNTTTTSGSPTSTKWWIWIIIIAVGIFLLTKGGKK